MQKIKRWTDTYIRLSKINRERTLDPGEMQTLALSAYMTGRDAESYRLLEEAHMGYLDRQETKQAARSAFWLGLVLILVGERARGGGWIAKGERILSNEMVPDCAEKGLFLIPGALGALDSGHPEKSRKLFERVASIGKEFDDTDLIALGRLGHGQSLVKLGEVARGLKLLDETMIIVETEYLYPVAAGIIYCAVIETCRMVWDLRRAQEWTRSYTRWCKAQQDVVPFRGQCLVRRAEIIRFHGQWQEALEEVGEACELLTRPPGEPAAGEAFYCKAELQRLLGDFTAAEESYREAAKWGKNPQPGLALLRLAQGEEAAAETSIKNALQEAKDTNRRSELLPGAVCILVAVKQTGEALSASKELNEIAHAFDAPYLYAMSDHCQGAVFYENGKGKDALVHLQKALKRWNALQLPYESTRTRELKGLVYRDLNDRDNANVALAAARWTYEQLQAGPDLQRIDRLLDRQQDQKSHGLTLRELQVLQRVVAGKTNKCIAGELFISERTVDRHVSNIFSKLDVSSRVAATTFALRNNLFGNDPG